MKIAIINYGMGNVESVAKAIRFLGIQSVITNDPDELKSSTHIILPGVGAFAQGMANLQKLGLIEVLNLEVIENKKPFLGICLGMQLVASRGYESQVTNGLGWIEGEVVKMKEEELSIPHLGWNEIATTSNSFIKDFDQKDFYFIHSYHFKVKKPEHIAATVNYGSIYVSAIRRDNIFATQFHPEKSQTSGLALLKSFVDSNA